VLLLVKLRRRLSRNWHRGILVTLLILLITHPLDLFVIGYGTARLMRTGFWQRLTQPWWIMALAVIAIAAGIGMSAHLAPAHAKEGFERFGNITCLPMRLDAFHAFGHYAAILIFAGVMILPFAQRLLSSRFCQFLGRYSFSLYLVHFPVLFTVTCAVVVRAQGLQHGRAALSIAAGLLLTICLAWLFERYVDAPATRLSRRIAGQRPLLASLPARA